MKDKHTNKCVIIYCHKYSEGKNKCALPVVLGDSERKTSFKMNLCHYRHPMLIKRRKAGATDFP